MPPLVVVVCVQRGVDSESGLQGRQGMRLNYRESLIVVTGLECLLASDAVMEGIEVEDYEEVRNLITKIVDGATA